MWNDMDLYIEYHVEARTVICFSCKCGLQAIVPWGFWPPIFFLQTVLLGNLIQGKNSFPEKHFFLRYLRFWFLPLLDTIQLNRISCNVEYNGGDFSSVVGHNGRCFSLKWDLTRNHLRIFDQYFSSVSHKAGVFLPLNPIPQKNLLRCIPQRRRFCSDVGYDREKWYNTELYFWILSASHSL
jgi:hypothetical protein